MFCVCQMPWMMFEADHANQNFPAKRLARVSLILRDGTRLDGDWNEPRWDHTAPPSEEELRQKYRKLAHPILGAEHADRHRRGAIGPFEPAAQDP